MFTFYMITFYRSIHFQLICILLGRRRGGLPSHIPNVAMSRQNKIASVNLHLVPSSNDALLLYRQDGGSITEVSTFGRDPIMDSDEKKAIRLHVFNERFPSFDLIFFETVNLRPTIFRDALLFYIDITYRLSAS